MRLISLSFLQMCLFLHACSANQSNNEERNKTPREMTVETLIEHVKLAINPQFKDWILFENGTYIIFDSADTIDNVEAEAIKMMKQFGPVESGGPGGDFSVVSLTETEGWVVSGHGYGMYTYVHPDELNVEKPLDVDVGVYGRSKRGIDGETAIIIYRNRK